MTLNSSELTSKEASYLQKVPRVWRGRAMTYQQQQWFWDRWRTWWPPQTPCCAWDQRVHDPQEDLQQQIRTVLCCTSCRSTCWPTGLRVSHWNILHHQRECAHRQHPSQKDGPTYPCSFSRCNRCRSACWSSRRHRSQHSEPIHWNSSR